MDDNLLFRLWGKTNERDDKFKRGETGWRYHPAICHMIDVAYMAKEWLRLSPWLLDRFQQLAPGIEGEALRRLIVCIVALHDLAKVHRFFQAKSADGWSIGYGSVGRDRPSDHGTGFDHGVYAARIMRELVRYDNHKEWEPYLKLIESVAAHHGSLYQKKHLRQSADLQQLDKQMAVQMIEELSLLFGMPTISSESLASLDSPAFAMLLAGFTSVADWFGSQSADFPYTPIERREEARSYLQSLCSSGRAERILRAAGLLPAFANDRVDFRTLFPFPRLDPLQELCETISFGEIPGPEMLIIEALMGAGKTEIALFHSARAIWAGSAAGVYFALPTQASSNALLKRIIAFSSAIGTGNDSVSLALAHGARKFTPSYQQLLHRAVRARESAGTSFDANTVPSEVVAPEWLQSSKRVLLASIGVGTIDQAMFGAMQVRHNFVRLFALAGKVVVFDEIHAYDSYMVEIICGVLRWLKLLGAKVILLSATLPCTLRSRLLDTYGYEDLPNAANEKHAPYPQILHASPHSGVVRYEPGSKNENGDARPASDPPKTNSTLPITIWPEEVASSARTAHGATLALDLASGGGCVAWIRNTVKEAQDAWRILRARAEQRSNGEGTPIRVILLHSRYARCDRNAIETELLSILGKEAKEKRPERLIVVATQVIEQSVDIDFDAMISDLAPIDLLLQRLGREWRHHRSLAERRGHTVPMLYILLPHADERRRLMFGPSSFIYDADILARTSTILLTGSDGKDADDGRQESGSKSHQWELARDCRCLVAYVYDQDENYWSAERMNVDGGLLGAERAKQRQEQEQMKSAAQRVMVNDSSSGKFTLVDMSDDADARMVTRYEADSLSLVLLHDYQGRIQLLGGNEGSAVHLPHRGDDAAILALEETVMLSSVSFPWQGPPQRRRTDDRLEVLEKWWTLRHPHDNRVFVLLNADGTFTHEDFTGSYRRGAEGEDFEGLTIQARRNQEVPYDEL